MPKSVDLFGFVASILSAASGEFDARIMRYSGNDVEIDPTWDDIPRHDIKKALS